MAGYEISFDESRGFLLCRISSELQEGEIKQLCLALSRELAAARARGPLRLLWDHRGFRVLPDEAADEVLSVAQKQFRPGDRAAILVSNSLDKVQGKPKTADQAAFFMSENAASMWLSVGMIQAA